jgi:hypothetical protein
VRLKVVCLALSVTAACGDNNENAPPDVPEAPRCAPTPGPLPTLGHFLDPLAVELSGCVEGGLAKLPGRWFLRNPESTFDFFYPKFEGSCETGFTRSFFPADETDESQVFTQFTWTDGTRWYQRRSFQFDNGGELFEQTATRVLCMGANDTLIGTTLRFDNDRGETSSPLVGSQFGLKDGPASGLTEVGAINTVAAGQPIVGYNVWVEGNFAYVVGPSGLTIVDVSTPATPTVVGQVDPVTGGVGDEPGNGGYNDVRVVKTATKTVAYASPLDFADTDVIDVTDPANPVKLSPITEYSHSVQVVTTGNTTALYLATYTDAVPKYDVTNPVVPLRLGAAVIANGPVTGVHDLTVEGTHIYANYTESGMVALDVSGGLDNAVEEGRIETSYSHASWVATLSSGKKVILHGDEGLAGSAEDGAAFLRILDGDPTSPTYLAELSRYRSRKEVGIHNIQVVGDKIYLSYYQDGVRIVDIADPTQPTEVAHFNTWNPETAFGAAFEGAVGVRVANGHVFVADIDRGLIILDEE